MMQDKNDEKICTSVELLDFGLNLNGTSVTLNSYSFASLIIRAYLTSWRNINFRIETALR